VEDFYLSEGILSLRITFLEIQYCKGHNRSLPLEFV
jgi:hypothetical protein